MLGLRTHISVSKSLFLGTRRSRVRRGKLRVRKHEARATEPREGKERRARKD